MTGRPYCILVSSCDAYADCWGPFFTLLGRHWHGSIPDLFLNTESRSATDQGGHVITLRNGFRPWGDRLLRSLQSLPTEFVLYMQEDYFVKDLVDTDTISALVDLMADEGIDHIGLERGLDAADGPPSRYRHLSKIAQRDDYRISLQAGLWRTATLAGYVRRHESVWEFEWYGSRRAWRGREEFLHVNAGYAREHGRKVLPYQPTGIVQGRWVQPFVEELFAANGIEIDYSVRGFHDPQAPVARRPLPIRAWRRARSIF